MCSSGTAFLSIAALHHLINLRACSCSTLDTLCTCTSAARSSKAMPALTVVPILSTIACQKQAQTRMGPSTVRSIINALARESLQQPQSTNAGIYKG